MNIFTYWEGNCSYINKICIDSIKHIYGENHIHLTADTINDFIVLPNFIKNIKHLGYKSSFIRALLLYQHGGLWLDCDIILLNQLDEIIQNDRPMIWEEGGFPVVDDSSYAKKLELCNGILYSPPESCWIQKIIERFYEVGNIEDGSERTSYHKRFNNGFWCIGQRLFRDVTYDIIYDDNKNLDIGNATDFHIAEDATKWYEYWDGTISLQNIQIGAHIFSNAYKNNYSYPKDEIYLYPSIIESLECEKDIHNKFPNSLISQYLNSVHVT